MNKKLSLIFKSAVIAFALVFAACSQALQPGDDAFASNALSLSKLPSKVGVDPTTWDAFSPLPFVGISGVTAVNGLATDGTYLVAAGYNGAGIPYASRYDTVTNAWTKPVSLAPSFTIKPGAAHYLNRYFLVTAGTTSNNGAFSADGVNWKSTGYIGFGTKTGVYGSAEQFYVVAGQSGQAAYSDDLYHFTTIPNTITGWTVGTGGAVYINAGAYGDNTYVFGGGSSRIAWTKTILDSAGNLVPWSTGADEEGPFGQDGFINAMAFGAGVFVAAGNDENNAGVIAYSIDDGQHWTSAILGTIASTTIYAVTYGNGYFTAVNDAGQPAFSTDGDLWHDGTYINSVYGADAQVNAVVYYEATDSFVSGGGDSDGLKMATSVLPPTVR
jgi:hypothetical protein